MLQNNGLLLTHHNKGAHVKSGATNVQYYQLNDNCIGRYSTDHSQNSTVSQIHSQNPKVFPENNRHLNFRVAVIRKCDKSYVAATLDKKITTDT